MLLKGLGEVAEASRPLAAADMVLVRLCHVADLPTPDEAIRLLADADPALRPAAPPNPPSTARSIAPAMASRPQAAPRFQPEAEPHTAVAARPELRRFEDVIARARAERDIALANALERNVRPVRFEAGQIEIALTPAADAELPQRLGRVLQGWTGRRWIIVISQDEVTTETARETREKSRAALLEEVKADPLVSKLLERFPGAEIVGVRERADAGHIDTGEEA